MAQTTPSRSINFGDNNSNCNNTIGSYNIYNSDKDAEIMRWLSPLEPDNRHHDVRTNRFEGVGDWLLGIAEFREWRGVKVEPIRPSCFAPGIREWERHI